MQRRRLLALAGTGLATAVSGCAGLQPGAVEAPLELLVWNHAHRRAHLRLYVLDDDEVLLAESPDMADGSSEIYRVTETAAEGDEFTVVVHETENDELGVEAFELVCSNPPDGDDARYVLEVEVQGDETLYVEERAGCS